MNRANEVVMQHPLVTRRTALQMRGGLSYQPYLDFAQPVGLEANVPFQRAGPRLQALAQQRIIFFGRMNPDLQPAQIGQLEEGRVASGVRHVAEVDILLDDHQLPLFAG